LFVVPGVVVLKEMSAELWFLAAEPMAMESSTDFEKGTEEFSHQTTARKGRLHQEIIVYHITITVRTGVALFLLLKI